jgi:hypothetical protein
MTGAARDRFWSSRRLVCGATVCAAALAAASGTVLADSPLRLDYCVEAQSAGLYTYTFTITLDNHDGSWQAGQGWDWLTFGDVSARSSPLRDFVVTSAFPGPWNTLTICGGGHNGPTFNPVTDAYWTPASVGESLTWTGTSSTLLDDGNLFFSTLVVQGTGIHAANFDVAHRLACGVPQGACCRPDGTCVMIGAASCTNLSGAYHGDGSVCANTNCPQPPTGACCRDSGCAVVSQAICAATSGVYHGDNATCGAAGCAPATAYLEGTDAGETPGTAASVSGTGPLLTIHGTFNQFSDADMYLIRICDPANFSANVSFAGLGEIFLFDSTGIGVTDRFQYNGPGTLTSQFVSAREPANYLLAVAVFLNLPEDANGNYLWLSNHYDNVERAPDGPGAANPMDHWSHGGGQDGPYTVSLTGACFVNSNQSSCYANCDHSTTPPVLNVIDFTCFLQKFAAADPYANCDNSTTPPVLNVIDFTCFLQKFAAGCQ